MDLGKSERIKILIEKVRAFIEGEIIPLEGEYNREIGSTGNRC